MLSGLPDLEQTLDSANVGLWQWNVNEDEVKFTKTARRMYGITKSEFGGKFKNLIKLVHPDDRDIFANSIRATPVKGHKEKIVYRIIRFGSVRWIESTGVVFQESAKNIFIIRGTCIDITPKIESQERLKAQLSIFNEIAGSTSLREISKKILMIIVTTFDWDMGKMTINDNNGNPPIKTTWPSMKNKPRFISKFVMPIQSEDKIQGVLEFYSTTKIPQNDTSILMLNAIKNNIGQVLEKQKILRDREVVRRQLESIFDNVPFGIIVEDKDELIINANKSVAEMFGKPSDFTFTGKNFANVFPEFKITSSDGHEVRFTDRYLKNNLNKNTADPRTFKFKNKTTGKILFISVVTNIIESRNGGHTILIRSFKDITKALEEKRQDDYFVGILGHELKNPIASIKAYAQLLKRINAKSAGKTYHYAQNMESQAARLEKLVSDIFDLTKFNMGKFQLNKRPLDLVPLIAKVITNYNLTEPKRIIYFKNSLSEIHVEADEDRVVQVLINLLSNATKYSSRKKVIEVATQVFPSWVEIKVIDHGMGIPLKYQSEVFKMFRVIPAGKKRNRHGLGMGLAIANEIVKAHGGEITIKSKPKIGSEFAVRLPI